MMHDDKKITLGILAHVDAGKTTLSEAVLYRTGEIRKLGRVDHKDTFLDDSEIERNRGITIFSRQARFRAEAEGAAADVTLIDTPGHVDFASEMERALAVIDYALVVVSGSEGVQAHTRTLYRLLKERAIPVFMFINKMDIAVRSREDILSELSEELGAGAVDFSRKSVINAAARGAGRWLGDEQFIDDVTLHSPGLAKIVLEDDRELTADDVREAVISGEIVPCVFGSALKLEGIEELISVLAHFTREPAYGDKFAARIFKVSAAENGERICFAKITGGSLKVRDKVRVNRADSSDEDNEGNPEEKINQIRLYSGSKYVAADEVFAGTVCAVTGLSGAVPGDTLGDEEPSGDYRIRPFMVYTVNGPDDMDPYLVMKDMEKLAEEDPALDVRWTGDTQSAEIRLMGQVQLEVLSTIIKDRYGYEVTFGNGSVLYLETVTAAVEGVGHFEPLRHYAEVHLVIEPAETGSGITLTSDVPEDELARNWQRLILTHLEEKEHAGVLTGAPLTDVRITLTAGKAHDKHTSGGDFREATYRAVRNALMNARAEGETVILEPWLEYDIELPSRNVGRAMTDIRQMGGSQDELEQNGDVSRIRGRVAASEIAGYQQILTGYTAGLGRMSLSPSGYSRCHNEEDVIEAAGYDPERDTDNPADSVFVSHGASDIVRWDEVPLHMHLQSTLKKYLARKNGNYTLGAGESDDAKGAYGEYSAMGRARGGLFQENYGGLSSKEEHARRIAAERELNNIFERTYGPLKQRTYRESRTIYAEDEETRMEKEARNLEIRARHERRSGAASSGTEAEKPAIIIIDGYNLIYADEYLSGLAKIDHGAAIDQLLDRVSNYAAYNGYEVTVVFDAYKVADGKGSDENVLGLRVIYTAQDEPADIRIGLITSEIRGRRFFVVSSDALVQQDSWGHGGLRISSGEFLRMLAETEEEIRKKLTE